LTRLPDKSVIVVLLIAGLSAVLSGQSEHLQISRTEWNSWERQEILQEADLHPSGIAANSFSDVVLLDKESYTLAVVDSDGSLRLTGGWGVEEERFTYSTDVAISAGLDIFLCDQASDRILRFDRKLNFITDIDLSKMQPTIVELPSRIAVNRLGEIIISAAEEWELYQLSSDTRFVSHFGGVSYGEERFGEISDLAVNSQSEIAVLDRGNERLTILNRSGSILLTAPLPEKDIVGVKSWRDGWLVISSEGSLLYLSPRFGEFTLLTAIRDDLTEIAPITDFSVIDDRVLAVNGSVLSCRIKIHE